MITEEWTLEMLRAKLDQTDVCEDAFSLAWDLPRRKVQDADSEDSFYLIDLPYGCVLEIRWPDGNVARALGDIVSLKVVGYITPKCDSKRGKH